MDKIVISNPVIWADVPDVSVIRVGEFYYMISTSMHSMPGCPIMKSVNLRDWELVNYVFDTLEDNDAHRLLDGKGIYGKGSWAASLRYHAGTYYVAFSCNDVNRFYIYTTEDIEQGPWERHVVGDLHHDPALLFDDGRVYVIYGNGDIRIKELTANGTKLKPEGIDQLLLETPREGIGLRCEGCHAYKLHGYYYLIFIEWPRTGHGRRRVVGYRSQQLLGPYERKVLLDDDMGYLNQGVAQGGLVDTPTGDWYAVLFQDHGAVGRIPYVIPVTWEDNWPVIGFDGQVPESFEVALPEGPKVPPLVISDEFDYADDKLALQWQWNHAPDHRLWSVTERPGHLRLRTGQLAPNVELARNTLTQRTEGPTCRADILLDSTHMQPGDVAGLVAMQHDYGTVGVTMDERGLRYVVMCVRGDEDEQVTVERIPIEDKKIRLKVEFDFRENIDTARFYYACEGDRWQTIGKMLQLKYTLHHFMGCRIGLFNYATLQAGGYVDVDYFHYQRE